MSAVIPDTGSAAATRRRAAVAERLATLVRRGTLDLAPPGGGRTRGRWARLAAIAEEDLALARLAEGHADALAILQEIGGRPYPCPLPDDEYWGVWAAEPPGSGLRATLSGGRWTLEGRKAFCSGARSCTRALVTARADGQRRLFAVDCAGPGLRPLPESWPADAMAASDTLDIEFDEVPAEPVGAPGAYLERPGFQHGGIGVAACWYGGARAVARTLHSAARRYDVGPHALAHLGAVSAGLRSIGALLDVAAAEIDADPRDTAGRAAVRSKQVRAATERVCGEVIDRVGRALGASPLAHDAEHARRVADLTLYLRQHHAERDHAALGGRLAELEWEEITQ
ncbi:MAG TPA: hypothetical protein VFN97_11125 [Actinospica sp.]|nr:hypothetical protein [Actinospica sp.]